MNLFKRMLVGVLILSVLGLYFPRIVPAGGQGTTTPVTEHTPKILAPPEKEIPVEEVAKEKKNTWLWVLLGAVAVGGLAALGGGVPDDDDEVVGDDTGSIVITGPAP